MKPIISQTTFHLPSYSSCDRFIPVHKHRQIITCISIGGLIFFIFLCCPFLFAVISKTGEIDSQTETISTLSIQQEDLQYAIVVDAGSSGSRAYIYTWPPHTGNPNELLHIRPLTDKSGEPIMKKIEPGLSSVAHNPEIASDYMFPLIQYAAEQIPSQFHSETPLYILATAGLRLLNSSQQSTILEDLRHDIPKTFNFSFTPSNVEIISGKQEAVYQWMAINYVFERFNHDLDAPLTAIDVDDQSESSPIIFRKQTFGILDMGGASMQIGFEITRNVQLQSLDVEEKTHLCEFNLGCLEHEKEHVYRVYVTTYLGLGANQVLELYNSKFPSSQNQNSTKLLDPCYPKDLIRTVTHNGRFIEVHGSGQFDQCREYIRPLLKHLTGCPGQACVFSFISNNFESMDWIGFSEFWYSMEDVLGIGGGYNFYKIQKAYNEYCATKWSVLQTRFNNGRYPLADESRLRNQCFKLAWITAILHDGLGLPYEFSRLKSSSNVVSGQVVHWTLGATLFRTRFFPLGAVQKSSLSLHAKSTSHWFLYLNHYLFVGCFLLVISSIVLYVRGLRKWCSTRRKKSFMSLPYYHESVQYCT